MFKTKLSLIDYIILSVIAGGIVAATILAMGKFRPEPRFGKFDVSSIVQERQKDLAARVKANMTEQEKQQLFDDAKNLGPALEVAIKAAAEECKCALFNSAAMLTAPARFAYCRYDPAYQGNPVSTTQRSPRLHREISHAPTATDRDNLPPITPLGAGCRG